MTDTAKLRAIIKSSGLKYEYIAESLGISYQGLKNKIENIREFKASEIARMCDILNIPERKDEIFFAQNSDLKSP